MKGTQQYTGLTHRTVTSIDVAKEVFSDLWFSLHRIRYL